MVLEKARIIVMMSLIQVCLASKARGFFFPVRARDMSKWATLEGYTGP